MIKAVIFDCFGVLYVDSTHAFYEKHVQNYDVLKDQLMDLNAQADYGLLAFSEWSSQVAALTGLDRQMVERSIKGEQIRNDELIELIYSLRKKGFKIGLLSNIGSGVIDRFFTPSERQELFDAVVLSSDVMLTKPHPRMFEITAEQLELGPERCVMVDDNPDNCAGADAIGMQSIRYESNGQLEKELAKKLQF